MTLPYPVGVVSVANFSKSQGRYHPPARRRIAVTFVGKNRTTFRRFLISQFNSTGGIVTETKSYKCAPGYESTNCGLPAEPSVYQMVTNTDFCLEPTGDTPTRSHFYLAVLAGCIPVIFDFDRGKVLHLLISNPSGHRDCLLGTSVVCVRSCADAAE